MASTPIHHIGSTFIRTKEELSNVKKEMFGMRQKAISNEATTAETYDFFLLVEVDDGFLDTGRLSRQQQIDDRVDVLFKDESR